MFHTPLFRKQPQPCPARQQSQEERRHPAAGCGRALGSRSWLFWLAGCRAVAALQRAHNNREAGCWPIAHTFFFFAWASPLSNARRARAHTCRRYEPPGQLCIFMTRNAATGPKIRPVSGARAALSYHIVHGTVTLHHHRDFILMILLCKTEAL